MIFYKKMFTSLEDRIKMEWDLEAIECFFLIYLEGKEKEWMLSHRSKYVKAAIDGLMKKGSDVSSIEKRLLDDNFIIAPNVVPLKL